MESIPHQVQGQKVGHWLNGEKILSYTLGGERVLAGVARKFKKFEGLERRSPVTFY